MAERIVIKNTSGVGKSEPLMRPASFSIDPDSEKTLEAMEERFRDQLARGIALPAKLMAECGAPAQPVWFGIDLAGPGTAAAGGDLHSTKHSTKRST